MRKIYVTTYSRDYPGQLVLTLPAKEVVLGYCCRAPEVSGRLAEAYVFEVEAPSRNRKFLPRRAEVIRVHAGVTTELRLKAKQTSHFVQVC